MSSGLAGKGPVRLSRRELEVARLVAEGMTNREIAARLFLSERTVDGHLEHVREKLGVNSRAQVAAWVVRHGDASPVAVEPVQPAAGPAVRRRGISRRWLWAAAALLVVVEAMVVLQFVEPQGPTIFTVAGSSPVKPEVGEVRNFSGDGFRATNALMSLPSDVAVSPDGSIYIADYRNERIRRVTDGSINTVAGGAKEPKGHLVDGIVGALADVGHASNVAIAATGRPYILTIVQGKLQVWTIESDRTMTMVVSVSASQTKFNTFWPPPVGGLAVSALGRIYISDRAANRVYSYAAGDAQPQLFAGKGNAGFSGDGASATGAELYLPAGLAIDVQGNVYIADTGNNRIRKVDTKGIITTVAGSGKYYGDGGDGGPATQARLSFPFGVAVARDGTLYIADTGNNRLRQVAPSGVILALAGTGTAGFSGDGDRAGMAMLAAPEGIALDGKGNLFVADTVNLRVREIAGVHP